MKTETLVSKNKTLPALPTTVRGLRKAYIAMAARHATLSGNYDDLVRTLEKRGNELEMYRKEVERIRGLYGETKVALASVTADRDRLGKRTEYLMGLVNAIGVLAKEAQPGTRVAISGNDRLSDISARDMELARKYGYGVADGCTADAVDKVLRNNG